MNTEIKDLLFKALKNKCLAEKDEAVATLAVYFSNPVGIGEHPQVVEEMMKMLDKAVCAQDKHDYLLNNFSHINPK